MSKFNRHLDRILKHLASEKLTGREFRIFAAWVSDAPDFHSSTRKISSETGIGQPDVSKLFRSLVEKQILERRGKNNYKTAVYSVAPRLLSPRKNRSPLQKATGAALPSLHNKEEDMENSLRGLPTTTGASAIEFAEVVKGASLTSFLNRTKESNNETTKRKNLEDLQMTKKSKIPLPAHEGKAPLLERGLKGDEYLEKQRKRERLGSCAIPLLGSTLLLEPGPHLICAQTGQGKTSLAASQVAWIVANRPEGRIVILLNEERPDDFATRVACILLGHNYSGFRGDKLPPGTRSEIENRVVGLLRHRLILEEADFTQLETCHEAIKQAAVHPEVCFIVLDYLQNVTANTNIAVSEPWRISKRLGEYIKEIGRDTRCPILIMGQCRDGVEPLALRIQNDKTFSNHCVTTSELKSQFDARTSALCIEKDRYTQMQGKEVGLVHRSGAYKLADGKGGAHEQ
jgi:hypothetical protein